MKPIGSLLCSFLFKIVINTAQGTTSLLGKEAPTHAVWDSNPRVGAWQQNQHHPGAGEKPGFLGPPQACRIVVSGEELGNQFQQAFQGTILLS
jgi:hypothetical protein